MIPKRKSITITNLNNPNNVLEKANPEEHESLKSISDISVKN